MKSMTGFGRSSNRSPQQATAILTPELDVSVRAVNGRYLEMRFHLPREYAGFESDFKSILSSVFLRGTLDIYINRARTGGATSAQLSVNTELAKQWLKGYRQLASELGLAGEPTVEMVTRLPEVLHFEERNDVTDSEKECLKDLVRQAAQACDQERQREGQALENELRRLCSSLEAFSVQMVALKNEARTELEKRYRERLGEALQKFGFDGKVDDQRLAQEIVIQLDRADVSEEITRLGEHLKAYGQLLSSADSQGKKLDFYAQELLREVNTIGSKSHIAKLTNLVVEAKTLVERIREQVQNVE